MRSRKLIRKAEIGSFDRMSWSGIGVASCQFRSWRDDPQCDRFAFISEQARLPHVRFLVHLQAARRRGANDVVIEMDRREFISLFGGAAAVPSILWPVAARAQQPPTQMRRIGILLPAAAGNAEFQAWVGAFLQ